MSELQTLTLPSDLDKLSALDTFLLSIQEHHKIKEDLFVDVMLAVVEAVTNGIIHGNKLDASKFVTITFRKFDNTLIFTVEDEGMGFNPNHLPNPIDDENLLKSGGRGVFLIKHYSDEVEFSDKGNRVTMSFNI